MQTSAPSRVMSKPPGADCGLNGTKVTNSSEALHPPTGGGYRPCADRVSRIPSSPVELTGVSVMKPTFPFLLVIALAAGAPIPLAAEAKASCSPPIISAGGAATAKAMAQRNAILKIRQRALRMGGTVSPESLQVTCTENLLWNCTARAKLVDCPPKRG